MGADVYLHSRFDDNKRKHSPAFDAAASARDLAANSGKKERAEKLQQEVEAAHDGIYAPDGYFRDSYNKSSLLWQLDLSWWRDVALDEDGFLQRSPRPRRCASASRPRR